MDTNVIIYHIIVRLYHTIEANMVYEPFFIYPHEYKNDKRALTEAMQEIVENDIIMDFEIMSFDQRVLILNVEEAYLSEYGLELAKRSKTSVRIGRLFNKAVQKYNDLQEEMYGKMDKYEGYTDEQLKRKAASSNFHKNPDRMMIARILNDRGYGEKQ